nr:acyl-CoA dehydrogenase family protein [uncultured Gellertiella sp.]
MNTQKISLWRKQVEDAADIRTDHARIEFDPDLVDTIGNHPASTLMNRLGLPEAFGGKREEGLVWRTVLYETLAAVDPAFIVSAPGPGMAGFVVSNLGDPSQQAHFFRQFRDRPTWSFFALTEPLAGSDAGNIQMRATQRSNGDWCLTGEKYLVGQAWRADIGVVFARTAEGPLGISAFLIEPQKTKGIVGRRLDTVGLRGVNLSHIVFDNVIVSDEAHLGRHLKPTMRVRVSASATFDAMRPCVGAIALGIARGALDRAEASALVDADSVKADRLSLQSLFEHILDMSAAGDRGERFGRSAGLAKVRASEVSEDIITRLIEAAPAGAAAAHPWLAKAFRDVRAIEYTEGVSTLHRQNAATLFVEAHHATPC